MGAAELLTRRLEGEGYRTHHERTGRAALIRARELRPAAMTLDIVLPDIDGWEVITRLKRDPATSAIPVVIVSVVDHPQHGLALGAVDYLVKPVDPAQLIKRLNDLLSNRGAGAERPRVLVVDDEAANRSLMTRTLEPAGFAVLTAAGGREAIELTKSERPDLVLLDLMMPEVSGFDVVEALRTDSLTRETPMMVVTSATLTEDDRRALNGRVSSILSRGSVGAADIVSALERAVQHRPSRA